MEFLIWLAVIGMIALYTFQSLFTKLYTDHYPGDPDMASSVLTVVSGLTVAVITFFGFSLCQFTVNAVTDTKSQAGENETEGDALLGLGAFRLLADQINGDKYGDKADGIQYYLKGGAP